MTPNIQKASMWKRISAFLFDAILLGIVSVLFAWAFSSAFQFDKHNADLNERYAFYGEKYGVSFRLTLDEYEQMTEDGRKALDDAYAALGADEKAVYAYNMLTRLTFLITTLGILCGYLTTEFLVPLWLKEGRTLGKKAFGLAVMRKDGVRINTVTLFVRTILGKFTVETMIPVYLLILLYLGGIGVEGTIFLLIALLTELILPLATKNHTPLHDLLAGTVAVDFGSQRLFDSREELIAYHEKTHAEKVAQEKD